MSPYQRLPRGVPAASPASAGPAPVDDARTVGTWLREIDRPLWVLDHAGRRALVPATNDGPPAGDVVGLLPAIDPARLGDPGFTAEHRLRYPYLAGAMANGIGSVEVVEAMGRAGMLAFFGAAGLTVAQVERAVERLQGSLGNTPHGFNLIHSPNEPAVESGVVDLYLVRGVRCVEASAYLDLTLPLVRYRVHGIRRAADGSVETPNTVIAKASRVEVAQRFFAPPPAAFLDELVARGELTAEQSRLAQRIPVAHDLTAEADSGGHTDNQPALTLLPTLISLARRLHREHGYARPLRVGAAGGISTPTSVAAVFAMGAAWVLTGTVNQACVESGSSDLVRSMLAEAEQADVIMCPAADMFEMGVQLQVLKRGTLFPMRAQKLFELYRAHDSLEAIPAAERTRLEKTVFRASFDEVWERTRTFFQERDPAQVERGERDPKHRLALVCRWYLGLSSVWANRGDSDRKIDFQVWCGPAMGAFNEWVRGSYLEAPGARHVVTVARNLLYGAALLGRIQAARTLGIDIDPDTVGVDPVEPSILERYVH